MARGANTLGRPKRGEKPKHKSSKGNPPGDERESIVHIQGTLAYWEFVKGVADKTGIPKTTQFRIAYRKWCEENGHGTPPGS